MTTEQWNIIGVVAQSIAALGTLAAVGVSLYLASRAGRPRLIVDVKIGRFILPPTTSPNMLIISVANAGPAPVTVSGLYWEIGVVKKTSYFQTPHDNFYSSSLPRKIDPGESATWAIPLEVMRASKSNFFERLASRASWWHPIPHVTLKVGTVTQHTVNHLLHKNIWHCMLGLREDFSEVYLQRDSAKSL